MNYHESITLAVTRFVHARGVF